MTSLAGSLKTVRSTNTIAGRRVSGIRRLSALVKSAIVSTCRIGHKFHNNECLEGLWGVTYAAGVVVAVCISL